MEAVNDDFTTVHQRQTNADVDEIEMAGMSTANQQPEVRIIGTEDTRFDITPPSIQSQVLEERESFLKSFVEHNKVNLSPGDLKALALNIYKDKEGDWYLQDVKSSKTVRISGAKKQPLAFSTIRGAWVKNLFTDARQTKPKYPIEANVIVRQQIKKWKILKWK